MLSFVLAGCGASPRYAEPLAAPPPGVSTPPPHNLTTSQSEAQLVLEEQVAEEAERREAMGLPPLPDEELKSFAARMKELREPQPKIDEAETRQYEWPGTPKPSSPRTTVRAEPPPAPEPEVAEHRHQDHKSPVTVERRHRVIAHAEPKPLHPSHAARATQQRHRLVQPKQRPAAPQEEIPVRAERRYAVVAPAEPEPPLTAPPVRLPEPPKPQQAKQPPAPVVVPLTPPVAQAEPKPAAPPPAQTAQAPPPPPIPSVIVPLNGHKRTTPPVLYHCPAAGPDGVVRCPILASWAPPQTTHRHTSFAQNALLFGMFVLLGLGLHRIFRNAMQ